MSTFLRSDNWLPRPNHGEVTQGQRDLLMKAHWGSREVTLRNPGGTGLEWIGSTGEDGLILVVRKNVEGKHTASIEDRIGGNRWASDPKSSPQIAVANLHRELKRLSRAASIGRATR